MKAALQHGSIAWHALPFTTMTEAMSADLFRYGPSLNGMHVNLYNNLWGTNFPLWYEENAAFRFALGFSEGSSADSY